MTRILPPILVLWSMVLPGAPAAAQEGPELARYVRDHYEKREVLIPVRDGVRLFTSIYAPKDASRTYPFLLQRTPYSVAPYGPENYREALGPSAAFAAAGYIFVYQDVRGRFMSEGEFVNVRPHRAVKQGPRDVDESSDTWDTVEWLLQNVPNHNGRAGMWGISYPGFYAAAGMIDAHPALKAVSPQAPIADWFFDDFHHHGAFFLPHAFNFLASFGRVRSGPTTQWTPRFDHGTPDGYQFFLDLGPLSNADARFFRGGVPFWNELAAHPNYDEFWQERCLLPHLRRVAPAVLTVGGWFDAEDLYGPLKIYSEIERENPGIFNALVMGPWSHGGWGRGEGDRLGAVRFGSRTSRFFREQIELPFFEHFLKDQGELRLPEAYMFETGANRWRRFDRWPPPAAEPRRLNLRAGGRLSFEPPPSGEAGSDEYLSDPRRPVPYTQSITTGMTYEYMTEDQRFAARRQDVLSYQTEPLEADLTLAGPIQAELWVATTGTDADWVVKLIDVFPPGAADPPDLPAGIRMGGYQMLVRSEVVRGRFRNSYSAPEPFVPGEPALVRVPLLDVLHTFQKGHRVMVQVQSTWFPLVDRNPQTYVENIFFAQDEDFRPAVHRVYCEPDRASSLAVKVFGGEAAEAGG